MDAPLFFPNGRPGLRHILESHLRAVTQQQAVLDLKSNQNQEVPCRAN